MVNKTFEPGSALLTLLAYFCFGVAPLPNFWLLRTYTDCLSSRAPGLCNDMGFSLVATGPCLIAGVILGLLFSDLLKEWGTPDRGLGILAVGSVFPIASCLLVIFLPSVPLFLTAAYFLVAVAVSIARMLVPGIATLATRSPQVARTGKQNRQDRDNAR